MVDDQTIAYSVEALHAIKDMHEKWVQERLVDRQPGRIKIRRVAENIPSVLQRLRTGKEILNLIVDCHAFSFDCDDGATQEQLSAAGVFLQSVHDWGDVAAILGPEEQIATWSSLGNHIDSLEELGLWVFGAREVQMIEGGMEPVSPEFVVAIIQVVRNDNPALSMFGPVAK